MDLMKPIIVLLFFATASHAALRSDSRPDPDMYDGDFLRVPRRIAECPCLGIHVYRFADWIILTTVPPIEYRRTPYGPAPANRDVPMVCVSGGDGVRMLRKRDMTFEQYVWELEEVRDRVFFHTLAVIHSPGVMETKKRLGAERLGVPYPDLSVTGFATTRWQGRTAIVAESRSIISALSAVTGAVAAEWVLTAN
jgi:hypothetical protein